MNRSWFRLFAPLAALAALATTSFAQPVAYDIDRSHSSVAFSVRHFFSKVPGQFGDFTGTLMIDEKNLSASSVDVTIQATSVDTNHERRDNHLRSADFFDVQKSPALTFKSTKIVPGEGTAFKIEGDLTIRGVTKPVVLDVESLGMGAVVAGGQAMGTRAGFEARTKIDRKEFGIVWNKALDQGGAMLGDDVAITIQIEAVKAQPKAEAQKAAAPAAVDKADAKAGTKK